MGIVQRCEAMPRTSVVRSCAIRLWFDKPVAMIKKIPTIDSIGFNSAAAFVQHCVVCTAQQHEIRQRSFAAVGPVLDVMTVDVAAVRATGKPARTIAQPQCSLDCG